MSYWSYDEFKAELKTLGHKIPTSKSADTPRGNLEYGGLCVINKKPAFVNAWHVGGSEGRGYWGGESHAYSTGNAEPEWEDLTNILEHFCPNITFLKYKGLMTKVHSDKIGHSDYYGNESTHSYRYIFIEDLYNFLRDHDLFERAPVDDSE